MRREPVLITMAIVALLSAANIVLTPEEQEGLQLLVEGAILVGGGIFARSQVASKESVERDAGPAAEKAVFGYTK